MTKTVLIITSCLALCLFGCSKTGDGTPEKQGGRLVSISATINADGSKASVTDAGQFAWASGDAIGVYTSDGKFTAFTLDGGEEGKSTASFSAVLEEGVNVTGPAVFPYNAGHSYNSGTRTISFAIPSTSVAWVDGDTKSPMVADYNGTGTISFSHVCGLIRVKIYNLPTSYRYVRFSSFNSKISGNFSVSLDNPELTAEASAERTDYTFSLTPEDVKGAAYTFDFPAPTGTYDNIRLAAYNSSWVMTSLKTSTATNTITAGKLLLMPEISLNTISLADFQNVEFPLPNYKSDSSYPDTTAQRTIVSNPHISAANPSTKVYKNNSSKWSNASGYFEFKTNEGYYSSGYRSGAKGFRMKVLYNNPEEAAMYYPHVDIKGPNTGKILPSRINGKTYSPQNIETWATLIKPNEWNVLQYDADCSGAYSLYIRPLVYHDASQKAEGSKIIYLDDFEFIK